MRKVIVSERANDILRNEILKENMSDIVKMVADYLDTHLFRASKQVQDEDGLAKTKYFCIVKDENGQPMKLQESKKKEEYVSKSIPEVFYLLQAQFRNIYGDGEMRDKVLKDILKKWFARKITPRHTFEV